MVILMLTVGFLGSCANSAWIIRFCCVKDTQWIIFLILGTVVQMVYSWIFSMPNNRHAIIIVMYICQDMSGWENVTVSWVLLNSLYVFFSGSYCLFKKGACPRDFNVGSIYWDDAAPFLGRTPQTYSGMNFLEILVFMQSVDNCVS